MNTVSICAVVLVAGLTACASAGNRGGVSAAHAVLAPTQGQVTAGRVEFLQVEKGLEVRARVSGLSPGGHGFHIHEQADCSAPDAMGAGVHFDADPQPDGYIRPGSRPHGHPLGGRAHHIGDLPMLEVNEQGSAQLAAVLPGLTLQGAQGILGRSVVVHAAPDDYTTQPTGNSGAAIACAVIVAN